MNLVIWRNFVWLFGAISFGYLAQFRLVVWRLIQTLVLAEPRKWESALSYLITTVFNIA